MKYTTKIPGYTLSEILVVLAITSIVIGIAFSVLTLVTKQYNAMRDTYQYRTEVLHLKQQLVLDFNQAETVTWDAQEQQLIVTSSNRTIDYELNNSYVLREMDTIPISLKEVDLYYAGNTVEEGIIDGLKLYLENKGRETQVFISRELDAQNSLQKIWD